MASKRVGAFHQAFTAIDVILTIGTWLTNSRILSLGMFCSCMLVFIAQTLNSDMRAAIDPIRLEQHDQSKIAKVFDSFKVMIYLLILGTVWISIFSSYPKLESCLTKYT